MSHDAPDRAYAASAEALRQNLLAYAGEFLELREGESVTAATDRGVRPGLEEGFSVEIDPGIGFPIPLVNPSMKSYRRRGPGSTYKVAVRALNLLAFARVWRRRGTVAPPAGTLRTSVAGRAFVERAGVDPQAFYDATWRPVRLDDKYAETDSWRSSAAPCRVMSRMSALETPPVDLPLGLPWMGGYSTLDAVLPETFAIGDDASFQWRATRGDIGEVRLPPGLAATVLAAVVGRPLRAVVSHPILDRYDLRIVGLAEHQRSTRMTVAGSELWRRAEFPGGNRDRAEVAEEMRLLAPARRRIEDMVLRYLTTPGVQRDVLLGPWDEDHWLDPEPEPEDEPAGIAAMRERRDREHPEDDPLIRLDGQAFDHDSLRPRPAWGKPDAAEAASGRLVSGEAR